MEAFLNRSRAFWYNTAFILLVVTTIACQLMTPFVFTAISAWAFKAFGAGLGTAITSGLVVGGKIVHIGQALMVPPLLIWSRKSTFAEHTGLFFEKYCPVVNRKTTVVLDKVEKLQRDFLAAVNPPRTPHKSIVSAK